MRFLLFLSFFCFQNLLASVQEYKQNDTRVIICDDFFLPIAKVGVIYPVGMSQLKNICEVAVLEEIFLSQASKISAKNLGANIDFNIHDNFSEVSAVVSNEKVFDILKIMLNNKPNITNLRHVKDRIKIRHKLSDYFETNLVNNEIYARIDSRYIFSDSILNDLTKNDIENTLSKYKNSSVDIVICGKLDVKQLVEKFNLKEARSSYENVDQKIPDAVICNFPKRTIETKSKFFGRSLRYMYQITSPEFRKKQDIIFPVLNYEIFNYLKKYTQLIDNCFITTSLKSNLFLIGFRLRRDVSQKSFESNFKNFFSHLKKTTFSSEKLKEIAKLEKFSEINMDEDIYAKYLTVRNKYILRSQSQKDTSEEILKISHDTVKNFVERVLENNFVAKISTQYEVGN